MPRPEVGVSCHWIEARLDMSQHCNARWQCLCLCPTCSRRGAEPTVVRINRGCPGTPL